jgi:hypothetical protein
MDSMPRGSFRANAVFFATGAPVRNLYLAASWLSRSRAGERMGALARADYALAVVSDGGKDRSPFWTYSPQSAGVMRKVEPY